MQQQLWHLWPHTKRHLYLCIAAVLALYVRTENATPLRVAIIVAVNVLPASAHAPAAVVASMFLPPLDGAALPPYLRVLLSRAGLAATAALQLAALSLLSNRRWRASLGGERWAPAPRWVARAVLWSRWANVVVFGLFAGALGAHAARRQNEDRAFPYLAGQYYAAHLASALCASVLALLDRRARHASLALLLAPSRYVNWALQTREAVAAGPHPFPLFALAAACEALRIAYGHAYALHGKRWRFPNAVPLATACLETAAFLRAALASRLLFTRWLRAPQLLQGACFALGAVLRYRRHHSRDDVWIDRGAREIVGRVYAPDDQGEKVDVDLDTAPGKWHQKEVRFRIADDVERVKIQGAMREVCRVDGTSIFGVERCVAKAYTRETREWLWSNQGVGDGVYFRDVHAHHVAGKYAADFNAKAPGVRVEVVPAVVVEVLEVTNSDQDAEFTLGSDRRYLHIEPFIEGALEEFTKYNSNTFDASLLLSDRHADPIAEAYSHFTWAASAGQLVVSDVQGVRNGSTLMVTDPQIHTSGPSDAFGAGNGQSEENVRAFFASHECRGICSKLGLAHPFPDDVKKGLETVSSGFSLRPFFTRQDYFRRAAASSKFRKQD
jgi:hypothetical protein